MDALLVGMTNTHVTFRAFACTSGHEQLVLVDGEVRGLIYYDTGAISGTFAIVPHDAPDSPEFGTVQEARAWAALHLGGGA